MLRPFVLSHTHPGHVLKSFLILSKHCASFVVSGAPLMIAFAYLEARTTRYNNTWMEGHNGCFFSLSVQLAFVALIVQLLWCTMYHDIHLYSLPSLLRPKVGYWHKRSLDSAQRIPLMPGFVSSAFCNCAVPTDPLSFYSSWWMGITSQYTTRI